MRDTRGLELDVGAIIAATGYKPFDARRIPQYGYGRYPNVYTAPEVERLLNASGPTQGEIVLRTGERPADGWHHPLRRLARRQVQPLLLPRVLHVLAEAGPT